MRESPGTFCSQTRAVLTDLERDPDNRLICSFTCPPGLTGPPLGSRFPRPCLLRAPAHHRLPHPAQPHGMPQTLPWVCLEVASLGPRRWRDGVLRKRGLLPPLGLSPESSHVSNFFTGCSRRLWAPAAPRSSSRSCRIRWAHPPAVAPAQGAWISQSKGEGPSPAWGLGRH